MKRWAVEVDSKRLSYYDQSGLGSYSFSPTNLITTGILDFTFTDSLLAII